MLQEHKKFRAGKTFRFVDKPNTILILVKYDATWAVCDTTTWVLYPNRFSQVEEFCTSSQVCVMAGGENIVEFSSPFVKSDAREALEKYAHEKLTEEADTTSSLDRLMDLAKLSASMGLSFAHENIKAQMKSLTDTYFEDLENIDHHNQG